MSEQKPIVLWTFLQRPQEFHIIDGPFLEFVIDTHDQHLKAVKTGIADPSKSPDPNLFMPKILSIFDKIWKPYYGTSLLSNPQFLDNAENSTGFNEFTKKYEPEIEYPQIVYDAIAENKPYYDYLYQFKI
ncbi:45509_t:CDS:2 [Gigaspora margarita]|uniref:45509_t:CDS:1 n=1 Tax=Gigaspora margarita TaxID=4874 RepID=A0ABN7VEL0_GIGMA|nr:45509_t:CDS:2 [Gigaspora margarita]